jgi:hypothetical protein
MRCHRPEPSDLDTVRRRCDRGEGRSRESYNLFTVIKGDIQMINAEAGTAIDHPIEES